MKKLLPIAIATAIIAALVGAVVAQRKKTASF